MTATDPRAVFADKTDALAAEGADPDLVARMAAHVATASNASLTKISPPALAAAWGVDPHALTHLFLAGTRLGLFDLEWDVRCPSCYGSTQLKKHLSALRSHGDCQYCEIGVDISFDQAVEVTFRVHDSIRDVSGVGMVESWFARTAVEPLTTVAVDPGGVTELAVDLEPGTHHLFDMQTGIGGPMRVTEGGHPAGGVIDFEVEPGHITRPDGAYEPGSWRMRIRNTSGKRQDFKLSRALQSPWLSAAQVASNQYFRDFFSAEMIHDDEDFAVRSLSFVFTDIRGSTELYERLGDSGAYALVKAHFRIIEDCVRAWHGGIVKTIGDAVMATYARPDDALQSVLAMHAAFDAFNLDERDRDDVVIKVGIHEGPCIAVTSNERLDYFGRTVNLAARVQGLSEGRDIILSRRTAERDTVAALLADAGWSRSVFHAELKGIPGTTPVVRLSR